jgi:hypothetical protein
MSARRRPEANMRCSNRLTMTRGLGPSPSRSWMASTRRLAWRRPGTVASQTTNKLLEPSSTLSVHENQVRGMSNTT